VTYQTAHGQLLDLTTAPPAGAVDLGRFTMDAYLRIVTYKTVRDGGLGAGGAFVLGRSAMCCVCDAREPFSRP
jgi:hypothetical protein